MYYEKRLQNCNKNSSETWKVINDITKRKKKDNDFPHILKVNEKSVNNPIDIVNNLNLHFVNIGKTTCLKSGNRLNFSNYNIKTISNSFVWSDVEENEVINIIKNLNSNKASGEDNISIKILKKNQ